MNEEKVTVETLREIPLFASLPPEEIHFLAERMSGFELPAGTILFHEGDPGDRFYIILSGQLSVLKELGSADERLLNVQKGGDFIGEMGLLDRVGGRSASVRADTPVQLLEMSQADFHALLHRRPEVAVQLLRRISERLQNADNAVIRDLQDKNRQLALAYEELKAAQLQIIEKEKLDQELQLARQIQESTLPLVLPEVSGYEFGGRVYPARAVGGDLFDIIPTGPDQVAILVFDVSDKGIPAAIFVSLARSLFRAEITDCVDSISSPGKILANVNAHLLSISEAEVFITVLYGVLDLQTGEFAYARAGHERPVIFDQNRRFHQPQLRAGQPLGVFLRPALDEQKLILPPGGILVLYTDGITDAGSPEGDFFGVEGLRASVLQHWEKPALLMTEAVIEDVQSYQKDNPQKDDLTLVVVKRDAA